MLEQECGSTCACIAARRDASTSRLALNAFEFRRVERFPGESGRLEAGVHGEHQAATQPDSWRVDQTAKPIICGVSSSPIPALAGPDSAPAD